MMTSIQDVAPFVMINITDLSLFQEYRRLKVTGN